MDNKYYTPDIEDIRVGYECELKKFNEWVPWTIVVMDNIDGIIYAASVDAPTTIRVPYLTKKQIEADGWKIVESAGLACPGMYFIYLPYTKGNYILWHGVNNRLYIAKYYDELNHNYCVYNGSCPSINEFRYITKKLLKI